MLRFVNSFLELFAFAWTGELSRIVAFKGESADGRKCEDVYELSSGDFRECQAESIHFLFCRKWV